MAYRRSISLGDAGSAQADYLKCIKNADEFASLADRLEKAASGIDPDTGRRIGSGLTGPLLGIVKTNIAQLRAREAEIRENCDDLAVEWQNQSPELQVPIATVNLACRPGASPQLQALVAETLQRRQVPASVRAGAAVGAGMPPGPKVSFYPVAPKVGERASFQVDVQPTWSRSATFASDGMPGGGASRRGIMSRLQDLGDSGLRNPESRGQGPQRAMGRREAF